MLTKDILHTVVKQLLDQAEQYRGKTEQIMHVSDEEFVEDCYRLVRDILSFREMHKRRLERSAH